MTFPRLRFGIRTLLVLTALGGILAWRVREVERAYQNELEIVKELRSRGAWAYWKSMPPSWLPVFRDWEAWKRVEGVRADDRVPESAIGNYVGTDEIASLTSQLKHVRYCFLYGKRVTNTGIAELSKLLDLEILSLGHCSVSAEGLASLKDLPLKQLRLHSIAIDGTGLQAFRDGHLERLVIGKTITDAGLEAISQLDSLSSLEVSSDQITDAGLRHLDRMANLRKLTILGDRLTVDGIRPLGKLPQLESLITVVFAEELHDAYPNLDVGYNVILIDEQELRQE